MSNMRLRRQRLNNPRSLLSEPRRCLCHPYRVIMIRKATSDETLAKGDNISFPALTEEDIQDILALYP